MDLTEIRLLGPLEALRAGEPVPLGGAKQRTVLALLALRAGNVVSAEALVDGLWGENAPATAATVVQGHVSRLRRLLGPEAIVTRPPGYLLADTASVDLGRFQALVVADDDPVARAARLGEAAALWRGPALADIAGEPGLIDESRRLDELRLAVQEELFGVVLDLGRHAETVRALEEFVRGEPLRERPVGQLMLALYRSGRQADALHEYRALRQRLQESLGLEPGQALRELERRILAQDPALAPPEAAAALGERRSPASVVAVGFTTGDNPAGGLDTEAYGKVVAQGREAARLALERNGGSVQAGGGGLVALFGVPAPLEDDAARAIQAARVAVDEVAAAAAGAEQTFGIRLQARAAVASGEAYAGESPAVEVALALLANTKPGEVTVDGASRARARGRELRLDRPLAGRELERQLLHETCERAMRDRRSASLALVGPPGIGKSRLAAGLLASLGPDTRVLVARCISYGDGISRLPAIDLVRAAAMLPAQVSEERARELIAPLLGDGDLATAALEQLLRLLGHGDEAPLDGENAWAVCRLLVGLAERSPVVVYVDDLHWASPGFLELLEQLAEPSPVPLVLLVTSRVAPEATLAEHTVDLGPLAADACAELVVTLVGSAPVEPAALASLVDASGGNPLFLEELVLDLRDAGALREGTQGWQLDGGTRSLPRSIESLLAARIDRLLPEARELIAIASVLGRAFALAALVDLAGEPVDEPVASLIAGGLLQPSRIEDDDLEFRHLLIRDAAYASLPLERRAELHERHAAWVDRSNVAAPLERDAIAVYHLDQAHQALVALAPGDDRVTAAAAPLAARTAALGRALLGRGDAASAAALFGRARELDPGDLRIAVDLGRAHLDVGDFAPAEEAFAAAAAAPDAWRARLGLLEVRLHTDPASDLEAAKTEIDAALAALERAGDTDGVGEAWLAAAYVALVRGRAAELSDILEHALAHARSSGLSRAEAWILFLVCGACWYGPLAAEDGVRRCEQVLADARDRPTVEAAALQSLAVLRAMQGRFDEARELVASSREIRRQVGQRIGAAASAIDEGIVELLAGEHAAAEVVLREGYAELDRLGEKGYLSTLVTLLAEAVGAQGRTGEAGELARAAAVAAGADDLVSQVGWRASEARALAVEGRHDEAERIAREATALGDATDFVLPRAEAWAALADVLELRGSDEAALARATAIGVLERKGCAPAAVAAWARQRSD